MAKPIPTCSPMDAQLASRQAREACRAAGCPLPRGARLYREVSTGVLMRATPAGGRTLDVRRVSPAQARALESAGL